MGAREKLSPPVAQALGLCDKCSMTVRLRFAPSPTGSLHIGGVRTALYNWLYARNQGGAFLLRIEDTDLERSEERFTLGIMESMKWLGMTWDEEPIHQSKKLEAYSQVAHKLVSEGKAYYCTCTEADVEKMREIATAAGLKPMYNRHCRGTKTLPPSGTAYVIRLAVPLDGAVEWNDLVRGEMKIENTEVDDFVLIRASGAPMYNLSVVVDDGGSRITHVIRGEEHTTNTPKQIHLYRALGLPVPTFGHLPVILAADKKKLSKRHGAVATEWYREEGYLPGALLNFLVRLGWSHGDQEVFTVEEMTKLFGFDHVQKASAVFNSEKLLWLNGEHIRRATPAALAEILARDFSAHFSTPQQRSLLKSELGHKLVALLQPKAKLLKEMAEMLAPILGDELPAFDASQLKSYGTDATRQAAQATIRAFYEKRKPGMTAAEIDALIKSTCEVSGTKLGEVLPPLRMALSGRAQGLGVGDLFATLPEAMVQARIGRAL